MFFLFAAMAGGVGLIFRGIDVIDCRSVSFSRNFTTCFSNDFGALTGSIAGGGLIVVGVSIFVAAMIRFGTVR